jgi:uncharacterized membrane protein YfcA
LSARHSRGGGNGYQAVPDDKRDYRDPLRGRFRADPSAILNLQFFGSALLAWGVITWFARDLDWAAVRGVLIGGIVGDVVGGLLSVWAIVEGLVNAFGWTSVVIYVLLLLGGLYFLSTGSRKPA